MGEMVVFFPIGLGKKVKKSSFFGSTSFFILSKNGVLRWRS